MKKTSLLLLGLLVLATLSAQQEYIVTTKSLYERVTKIEKKSDNFHFYLHINGSFDAEFNKNEFQQSIFRMNQLRLEAAGNINSWLSYRWRQLLNRPNEHRTSIDNLPANIDFALLRAQVSNKFFLTVGRQCAAIGGIEFDMNPTFVYQYSDFSSRMTPFLTGVGISYQPSQAHEWQLQVLDGSLQRFEQTYSAPGIERSTFPFLYSLNWNGNLFDGVFRTRWSGSFLSQAKDKNLIHFALGNIVTFSPNMSIWFDALYSLEDIDKKGYISDRLYGGERNAFNTEYLTFIAKLDYRFVPRWNLFVKGMYETASVAKPYDEVAAGRYRTSIGYLAGIEYYPMETGLRFFLAYIGHSSMHGKKATSADKQTNKVSLGFMYQLPMF